ncbi:hypothetical protein QIS99_00445 [Streptomyces sp. B-S-A8]|uniref:Uncharacterized protein n=1 Tax=Streptomyces solicavernae TaxID=3043614 RepID=A0ABT6RJU5_9ACTN|nr:hypothetical protein [Streptomyces sp. B-S-A8]MDI3384697.1 hypothetical protein [Streptomyces sp. B-S-A8]
MGPFKVGPHGVETFGGAQKVRELRVPARGQTGKGTEHVGDVVAAGMRPGHDAAAAVEESASLLELLTAAGEMGAPGQVVMWLAALAYRCDS